MSQVSPPQNTQNPGIVAAFYAPWKETGYNSLLANADKLTHLLPVWLHVSADGANLDFSDWDLQSVPLNRDVVRPAHEHGVAIMPVLSNEYNGIFDSQRAHSLLANTANQWRVAERQGVRGAALWLLGDEDPAVWSTLQRGHLFDPVNPAALEQIDFGETVEFMGDGEIWQASALPQTGTRALTVDKQTGLITSESYVRFPNAVVIQRSGAQSNTLALTFADGPAEPHTGQLLDELKALHVPATFFVIGQNAGRYPGLVQRFRWEFGTLQCLWKHRDVLGRAEWFGRFVAPSLWLFRIGFPLLAPLKDLQVVLTLLGAGQSWLMRGLMRGPDAR